jgi:hypothetical protein
MLFFQGIAPVSVPRPTNFPAERRFRQPLPHIKPGSPVRSTSAESNSVAFYRPSSRKVTDKSIVQFGAAKLPQIPYGFLTETWEFPDTVESVTAVLQLLDTETTAVEWLFHQEKATLQDADQCTLIGEPL